MQSHHSIFHGGSGRPQFAAGGSQTPIIVVLALVIAGAVALSVFLWIGDGKSPEPTAQALHMWCTETKKEYTVDPKTIPADLAQRMFELQDTTVKVPNPDTGRPTLIRARQCPNCREHFIPESWRTGRPDPAGPTCPHCKTNVRELGKRAGAGR